MLQLFHFRYLSSLVAAIIFLSSCSPTKPHWEQISSFRQSGEFAILDSAQVAAGWTYSLTDNSIWNSHKEVSSEKIGPNSAAVARLQFDFSNKSDILSGLLQFKHNLPFVAYLNGQYLTSKTPYDYPYAFRNSNAEADSYDIFVYHRPTNIELPASKVTPLLQSGQNNLIVYTPANPKTESKYFNDLSFSLKVNSKQTVYTSTQPNVKPDGELTSSELPILKVETRTPRIPDEPKVNGLLHIDYPEESKYRDALNLELDIEVRGTTSQAMSKKSFSIDIEDYKDLETVLGMPSNKDWVLHGPYMDRTMLRNAFVYSTAKKMGLYSTRFSFCELVINGNYQGIYMLTEKIEFEDHRLTGNPLSKKDIDSLTAPSDGDFLLQIDRGSSKTWSSETGKKYNGIKHYYEFREPKEDKLSEEQQAYVKEFINEFETAIIGELHNSKSRVFEEYIFSKPFYDYIILNELTKNIDAYRLSTYMIMRGTATGGKIEPGPVWDYNFSLGLPNFADGYKTDGFIYNNTNNPPPFWWAALMENEHFSNGLRNRYTTLRQTVLHRDSLYSSWSELKEIVKPATRRNFARWAGFSSPDFWPNYNKPKNYDDACDYLNNWLTKRIAWLDEQWLEEPAQ